MPSGLPNTGTDWYGAVRLEIILMKRAILCAAAALVLTASVPEQADAQGRCFGVHGGVGRGPVVVGRGPVYAYPRGKSNFVLDRPSWGCAPKGRAASSGST